MSRKILHKTRRLYSCKVDRLSGDVLPDVLDTHNHAIDSIRHSLAPLIRQGDVGFLHFLEQEVAAGRQRRAEEPTLYGQLSEDVQLGSAMTPAEIQECRRTRGTPIHLTKQITRRPGDMDDEEPRMVTIIERLAPPE
jgi:hypothetical protein